MISMSKPCAFPSAAEASKKSVAVLNTPVMSGGVHPITIGSCQRAASASGSSAIGSSAGAGVGVTTTHPAAISAKMVKVTKTNSVCRFMTLPPPYHRGVNNEPSHPHLDPHHSGAGNHRLPLCGICPKTLSLSWASESYDAEAQLRIFGSFFNCFRRLSPPSFISKRRA